MTLAQAAPRVGISVAYLSQVERGDAPMPLRRREAFAAVLGLPVADLTPLDPATLAVVAEQLTTLGGCDRAVAAVREMGGDSR